MLMMMREKHSPCHEKHLLTNSRRELFTRSNTDGFRRQDSWLPGLKQSPYNALATCLWWLNQYYIPAPKPRPNNAIGSRRERARLGPLPLRTLRAHARESCAGAVPRFNWS